MRIGLDARTMFGRRARGTGRNLRDAFRLIPRLRPNHAFFLYHRASDDAQPITSDPNIRLRGIDSPGDRFDVWFQLRLPLAALCDRLDLLHLPANAAPAWAPLPLVVTIHDLIPLHTPDAKTASFARGIHRALRGAAQIITPSRATRDELILRFDANRERITVIPWAPDSLFTQPIEQERRTTESMRIREQYELDRPWLLNFSGQSKRKNAHALLVAFAALPKSVRDGLLLVLTGCEPQETRARLRQIAAELRIAEHCRMLGFVPETDIVPLLRDAHGLAMPSLSEGFGLPILDAMACGVPVLTSNSTSMPEVAGDAAAYCDPTQHDSIADGLQQLLDPRTRKALIERGAEQVAQFTWERTASAMCAVYERVAESARQHRAPGSRRSSIAPNCDRGAA